MVVDDSDEADNLNLGKEGELCPGLLFTPSLLSNRDTFVTESLGLPSMMSLSLFSFISFTLALLAALPPAAFPVEGFRLVPHWSSMGELDLELALSNDEDGEEEVAVAPGKLFSLAAVTGELGDDVFALVLSLAFSTDR